MSVKEGITTYEFLKETDALNDVESLIKLTD